MNNSEQRELLLHSLFDDSGMFGSEGNVSMLGETLSVASGNRRSGDSQMQPADGVENEERVASEQLSFHLQNSVRGPADESGPLGSVGDDDEEWIPRAGFVVEHIMEAFVRYSNYGRRTGFEIRFRSSETAAKVDPGKAGERRKRMKRGLGGNWFYSDYQSCSRVRLQCVKGEVPRPNRRDPNRPVRSQASKCMAGVSLVNMGDGCWVFKTVRLEHNHVCDPSTTRFMKSYRIVNAGDEMQIVTRDRAGVNPSRIFTSFAVEYGGVEKVPFTAGDCRAVARKARMSGLENGDFNAMQKLFNELIASSDDFFYLYDTDEEGRVKNVLWADGRSRGSYKDFGDVVCFDTTHLKNRYKMPLAPFIGVNHHGQSILLGLALISNETSESFRWVFEAWMKCMRNKHPQCIMTDQCQAIGNAIKAVFPHSCHRWCLWHVMRNAEQHLKRNSEWVEIRRALKEAVHDSCDVDGFEGMWEEVTVKFGLQENDWMQRMYASRTKWVPVYFKNEFWAGLHSTQRSEGMNNFFRSYVNMNTTLRQFVEQYCLFVGKRVDDEERENWRSVNKPILCDTRFPCERVLQEIYTSNKFVEVQKEAKGVVYTNIEVINVGQGITHFMVTDRGVEKVFGGVITRRYSVYYNPSTHETECDCSRFNFRGIICRHMIAVWQIVELRQVPHKYILDRWRKDKFREYSIIKIPNYSLALDKTVEYRKAEELHNLMRYIGSLALGCDDLYTALMPGLEIVKKKCDEFIGSYADLNVDSVGRFYKKHAVDGEDCHVPDLTVQFVLDPPDKRGRGRLRTRRQGFRKDKRKRATPVNDPDSTHVFFA